MEIAARFDHYYMNTAPYDVNISNRNWEQYTHAFAGERELARVSEWDVQSEQVIVLHTFNALNCWKHTHTHSHSQTASSRRET